MQDFYQKYYKAYHEKTFHIDPSSFLEPLIRHLKSGDRILDVGCGSGRDLCWLNERGFRVTGFERSEGLAALARKYAGCEIIEGNFEDYDFSQLSFDAVIMSGSLVHIPHKRLEPVFGKIVNGLRSDGKVLVSLKQGEGSVTGKDCRTFYFWQDIDLRKIFTKHAFIVLDFQRNASKASKIDMWLSYVLKR